MSKTHRYQLTTRWTGNRGAGTSGYRDYDRAHTVSIENKPDLLGSSDPAFRGDPKRHNPEELLVASLSTCHLLWFLHLCADAGVVVTDYVDHASGTMVETADGGGHFTEVMLRPEATVAEARMVALAEGLHDRAHRLCFIANSVNFPVRHEPVFRVQV